MPRKGVLGECSRAPEQSARLSASCRGAVFGELAARIEFSPPRALLDGTGIEVEFDGVSGWIAVDLEA